MIPVDTMHLFLGTFVKLRKATISYMSVCLSVRPHGTTLIPLDRFLWNYILQYSAKSCPENSSFIKIWQKLWVLHPKTYID